MGLEHEYILHEKLRNLGVPFKGEDDLRDEGYPKTPDVYLEVPLSVDGRIVHWIESKASFGDPDSHQRYLREQYRSYVNRLGAGLVIYWFGFIDELDCSRDEGVLLADDFPDNVHML
eukprot:Colp12_sorted_trinity150504_noHs@24074